MADPALRVVPGPEAPRPDLVLLRARIATAVAEGRDHGTVLDDLIGTLVSQAAGSAAAIVTPHDDDAVRLASGRIPGVLAELIHTCPRRRWFGAWAAALTRRTEIIVPDIAASSLYREHQETLERCGLRAARAVPLDGRHGRLAGSLTWYLPEARLLDENELDLFDEVAALAELSYRHEHDRRELLDRIRHDPLTGLENRDGLEDTIRRALDSARVRGGSVGLLFVDIDDLTLVNDSLGHTAGDTVIATVADRISQQLVGGDAVVRFGGDEFIVVLEHIDNIDQAVRFADRIRVAIGTPITIAGTELNTTVCIGITYGRAGDSALRLIDEGHAAVVRAKQGGRGLTAIHDHGLDTGASDRLDREVRLRQAIDQNEFVIRWQPKIALQSGRATGAEALVRWNHPTLGIVAPDEFIGTAERAGLMNELSDLVIRLAVADAAHLIDADPEFAVAVNISATQIIRPDFVDLIDAALREAGVPAEHLILELTESVLASSHVTERLHELGRRGIRLAIDDFGTGYSSLAYVQQLPVAMVKIDRAFLDGLDESGQGAPVMAAAVAMAQALGLGTTVEGVETYAQLAGLRSLEVDWGQGYLFSEPVPCCDLVELIRSETSW